MPKCISLVFWDVMWRRLVACYQHFVITCRSDLKQSEQISFTLRQKSEIVHNLRIVFFFFIIHPIVCYIIKNEMCFVFDGHLYFFFKDISFGLISLLLFTHTY